MGPHVVRCAVFLLVIPKTLCIFVVLIEERFSFGFLGFIEVPLAAIGERLFYARRKQQAPRKINGRGRSRANWEDLRVFLPTFFKLHQIPIRGMVFPQSLDFIITKRFKP